MGFSEHDDLDRPRAAAADLIDDQSRPGVERDQRQPFLFKNRPERVVDHASRPGAPVIGDDATMGQPDRLLLGPLVENFVGGRIRHLARAAEPGRRRREKDQKPQRLGIDRLIEMMEALDLGIVNQVELGVSLIGDPAVGQHAGAVNQAADRPVLRANFLHRRLSRRHRPARRPSDRRPASRRLRCERADGGPRAGPGAVALPRRPPEAGGDRSARSSKARLSCGSSWISASQSGSAAGAGVRPSKTSRGRNDSARATATSAVTPRAPPLMTTRSPRSMRTGRRCDASRGSPRARAPRRLDPRGLKATSAGPRWNNSSTINSAACDGESKPGARSTALQWTSRHSWPAVLAIPARAPAAGLDFAPQARSGRTCLEPRHCHEAPPRPARRIVREPAPRLEGSGTRP